MREKPPSKFPSTSREKREKKGIKGGSSDPRRVLPFLSVLSFFPRPGPLRPGKKSENEGGTPGNLRDPPPTSGAFGRAGQRTFPRTAFFFLLLSCPWDGLLGARPPPAPRVGGPPHAASFALPLFLLGVVAPPPVHTFSLGSPPPRMGQAAFFFFFLKSRGGGV